MNKTYTRINWQNQPSTSTALGATNLNKIDLAVNTIDDRVIVLDSTKLGVSDSLTMLANWDMNITTGVITVTLKNGTIKTYDTALEKVPISGVINTDTNKLIFTNSDGTKTEVDIAKLITQYEFVDTDTIGFSIEGDGKVSCFVKDGSITESKLQPNYLADCQLAVTTSTTNANLSKRYAVGGVEDGDTTDNAKYYKEQAKMYKEQAQAIVGIDIATEEQAGLVLSGGDITVDSLGNVTVNRSSGNLDKAHLESVLSATGWYRIAEATITETANFTGRLPITTLLTIASTSWNDTNSTATFLMDEVTNKTNFTLLSRGMTTNKIFSEFRVVHDTTAMKKYLEVWYAPNTSNYLEFTLTNINYTYIVEVWKKVTPILINALADTETVYTSYKIPSADTSKTELDFVNKGKQQGVNLDTQGWYRIGKKSTSAVGEVYGSQSSNCIVTLTSSYSYTNNHTVLLLMTEAQRNTRFTILGQARNAEVFTKVRILIDTANATAYLDVYYNPSNRNGVAISVSPISEYTQSLHWESLSPTLVADTDDSLTAYVNYTIPNTISTQSSRTYKALNTQGWYRVAEIDGFTDGATILGNSPSSMLIDISTTNTNQPNQQTTLLYQESYNEKGFTVVSNRIGVYKQISKIRICHDTTTYKRYLDVFYTFNSNNHVAIQLTPMGYCSLPWTPLPQCELVATGDTLLTNETLFHSFKIPFTTYTAYMNPNYFTSNIGVRRDGNVVELNFSVQTTSAVPSTETYIFSDIPTPKGEGWIYVYDANGTPIRLYLGTSVANGMGHITNGARAIASGTWLCGKVTYMAKDGD